MENPLRSITTDSHSPNSPEFQFWRIPSTFPLSPLHSADELFSHGFILPLHHLHYPDPKPDLPEQTISAAITSGSTILTASKRWTEIFKRGDKKTTSTSSTSDESTAKSEKKKINRRNSTSAELNINLWPFSRSRSAGNSSTRSKPVRKVSSAPCSRSNSSGDSKSRRSVPSSPGRSGVHLGRSSPVVQLRRKPTNTLARKGRVLGLSVPMCIGNRQQLSCQSDENGGSGSNGNLFGLRGLFSKRSVLTV